MDVWVLWVGSRGEDVYLDNSQMEDNRVEEASRDRSEAVPRCRMVRAVDKH
jgi:hypothetical protein